MSKIRITVHGSEDSVDAEFKGLDDEQVRLLISVANELNKNAQHSKLAPHILIESEREVHEVTKVWDRIAGASQ